MRRDIEIASVRIKHLYVVEGAIDVPGLCYGQSLQLFWSGKYEVPSVLHYYIRLVESLGNTFFYQLEVQVLRVFRS